MGAAQGGGVMTARDRGGPDPGTARVPGECASGVFVARRRAWLLTHARRVCRNGADAEDLVQDVLLRFLQTFGGPARRPRDASCDAWLVTTLTRLFYDLCRKRRVRARQENDPCLPGEVMGGQVDSASPRFEAITDEQFARALRGLSPKLRSTFELHSAGLKYQDIAASQGISVGTVSKRMHDARAKLLAQLQPTVLAA
ncbi:RNA polymerase sigma factor [Myxococcaceae bacterium JPH2]|nr:RNA polymerase sigma factor [Myxococcaceae bacterium JPH2]